MRKIIASIKKTHPVMWGRYVLLTLILIMVTVIGRLHQFDQKLYPSVDALCPFGGLESLYSLLFQGQFLQRVLSSSLILLGATVVLALVAGRAFCGWLCPLGALQGLFHAVGKFFRSLFKQKEQPLLLAQDKYGRWLKYLMLIIFTGGAWLGGKMLIREYEPWVAYMHISEFDHALEEFPIGFLLLAGVLGTSLFITRPFCRYLCPMGAFLGLLSRFSLFRVTKTQSQCTTCHRCSVDCPAGLDPAAEPTISPSECLACGECVVACSKENTLGLTLKKWQLKPVHFGLLIPALFFGLIGLTQLTGLYNSTPPSIAQMKAAGNMKPEDIKGYMTLAEVTYLFDLQLPALYSELDLESSIPAETPCREIGHVTGRDIETDAVRLAVARLLHIPEQQVVQSCSNSGSAQDIFIPGTMTLAEVAQTYRLDLATLYHKLGLDRQKIPPTTPCRDLKYLVHPDYHTTVVRQVVTGLLQELK